MGISVIICTHNGSKKIEFALHSLISQSFIGEWELIVVNNNSSDDTIQVCTKILAQSNLDWKIVNEFKIGLSHARLRGIMESNYDILLFCDDDNALSIGYLDHGYVQMNNNPQIGAIGGCGIPVIEKEAPQWFLKYSHSYAVGPQGVADGILDSSKAELYGAGVFMRKAPLLKLWKCGIEPILTGRIGGKLMAGEDIELCYLLQYMGYNLAYESNLTFYHQITQQRLTWEYYIELKSGIAFSSALLFSYKGVLENPIWSDRKFMLQYSKLFIFNFLILAKLFVVSIAKPAPDSQLNKAVYKSKVQSYMLNFFKSFRHFRLLKKHHSALNGEK
ncbi:hypothetical protein GCM10007049_00640 [Echinicola pacifica]|uniref:Glycosyltransferase 2-like domain-containing protein n=1 Tax=Echinicola pacifica TaxID=346377 RepID=A0A918PJ72_9BACT|nr:glycosyltransferase [Echinicola pacifica]GGZ12814.1 hypothetical protein GCM10007049_00640 [Echinicola pacifica]